MRKYLAILLLFIMAFTGCKDFLVVEPLHKISGNAYWKSSADVEAFTLDLYLQFKNKLVATSFMPATGDLRSGFIRSAINANSNTQAERNRRLVYESFAINDLKTILTSGKAWNDMNLGTITSWREFYKVIQGANLLMDQLDEDIPGMSERDKDPFRAEAAFLRSLAYFMMVRIYGDVPYYTDAYTKDIRARESMVTVINKCIADVTRYKDGAKVSFSDPNYRAVRATKGALLDLLMNMNMWNAGFDKENAPSYYKAAADYGKELMDLNTYQLIPLENFREVTRGRSMEGVFEFNQSVNYGTSASYLAFFGEMMLKFPNKGSGDNNNSSHAYFKPTYLAKLYPSGTSDRRYSLWFNSATVNAANGNFELLKYKGELSASIGASAIPEYGLIIFRYAEALLLRAEALAELGQDEEARTVVNLVRKRAGAPDISESGEALKNAIFLERGRELMGEAHLYFDLIRTGRILSTEWTDNPLTPDQFARGGWTWPISQDAVISNPLITLNSYWQ